MHLDMWIRGHLCRVYAFFEQGDRGSREVQPTPDEWCIEDVQPLDGTTLDLATLTDSEWNSITNTLWEDAGCGPEHFLCHWEWFLMTDGPWNYESDDLVPLNEHISEAHREWRGYWL